MNLSSFTSLARVNSSDEMEQELDEEMRFHLERDIEQNIKSGMTPEDARYAALEVVWWCRPVKRRMPQCTRC